jgi:pyruvate dehydrogenase E2 component (dihydrolipoamide acetyltransferase)
MADFVMPSLGADMDEGTLVEWLVKAGDVVHRGDIVAVVDTTKSAIEVEVFVDGVIEQLLVQPGTTVPVGTALASLTASPTPDDLGGHADDTPREPSVSPRSSGEGALVAAAGTAGPAVASPIVRHLAHERGLDLATVRGTGAGGVITRADVDAAAPPPRALAEPPPTAAASSPPPAARRRITPLARRRADELGVDLAGVAGTGTEGAVTAGDVERSAAGGAPSPATTTTTSPAPVADRPARAEPTRARRAAERAAAMRQTIAGLMARSKREIPHYYLQQTVDMAAAEAFVRDRNARVEPAARLLPAVVLLKAAALAVRDVPEMNGFVVDGTFRRSAQVHLGVAVSLRGGGLVAPAIHDADTLPLPDLMVALKDLVARTRAGRLRGSQMSDPTITVTNLGDQGVDLVHGVIYPPQVALVGFGRVVQRPWAVGGMLTVRPVVTVTLAADHRVSDGHRGGRYLASIADLLQRPEDL